MVQKNWCSSLLSGGRKKKNIAHKRPQNYIYKKEANRCCELRFISSLTEGFLMCKYTYPSNLLVLGSPILVGEDVVPH